MSSKPVHGKKASKTELYSTDCRQAHARRCDTGAGCSSPSKAFHGLPHVEEEYDNDGNELKRKHGSASAKHHRTALHLSPRMRICACSHTVAIEGDDAT